MGDTKRPRSVGVVKDDTDARRGQQQIERMTIEQSLVELETLCRGLARVAPGQYERARVLEARGLCHRTRRALDSTDLSVGVLRQLRTSLQASVREIRQLRNTL